MYCCDKSLTKPLLSSNSNNNSLNNNSNRDNPRKNNKKYRRRKNIITTNQFQLKRSNVRESSKYEEFDEDEEDDVEFSDSSSCAYYCFRLVMAVRQLALLLWKNLLFRRRHYIVTSLEIILPTLLAMLMAYMRTMAPTSSSIDLSSENNTYFPLVHEQVFTKSIILTNLFIIH